MGTLTPEEFSNVLLKSIKDYLHKAVAEEFEVKKQELIASIDKRKDEIVAATLIDVMKSVDMRTSMDHVVFTVRKVEA